MGEECAERNTVVARESEELAGAGCNIVNTSENCHNDSNRSKNCGTGFGLRGIVKDLNEWLLRIGVQDALYVSEAETNSDQHKESKAAVCDGSPQHGARKGMRCIS